VEFLLYARTPGHTGGPATADVTALLDAAVGEVHGDPDPVGD